MATQNQYQVIVNYPTPDKQKEFDQRAAKAVARVLFDMLSPEKVDELIEAYKKSLEGKNS